MKDIGANFYFGAIVVFYGFDGEVPVMTEPVFECIADCECDKVIGQTEIGGGTIFVFGIVDSVEYDCWGLA